MAVTSRGRVELVCAWCGIVFTRRKSRAAKTIRLNTHHFCCPEHAREYKKINRSNLIKVRR